MQHKDSTVAVCIHVMKIKTKRNKEGVRRREERGGERLGME